MKAILCAFPAALFYAVSALLSSEDRESFRFSYGMPFVLLATVCRGSENNCTRRISSKSTYEIVILKGVFFRSEALAIAFAQREPLVKHHTHLHSHIFSHCHDGSIHEHIIVHSHAHDHCVSVKKHTHKHPFAQLKKGRSNERLIIT